MSVCSTLLSMESIVVKPSWPYEASEASNSMSMALIIFVYFSLCLQQGTCKRCCREAAEQDQRPGGWKGARSGEGEKIREDEQRDQSKKGPMLPMRAESIRQILHTASGPGRRCSNGQRVLRRGSARRPNKKTSATFFLRAILHLNSGRLAVWTAVTFAACFSDRALCATNFSAGERVRGKIFESSQGKFVSRPNSA